MASFRTANFRTGVAAASSLAVGATILLAACGSPGNSSTGTATGSATTATATAAAAGNTSATATNNAAAPAATTSGPPGSSAAVNSLTAFTSLFAQWNGSSFNSRQTRLTYKAVYTGVEAAGGTAGDCTGSAKTVTIEQNAADSLIDWPGCAEVVTTPSTTYLCQLTTPAQCYSGKMPNPFSAWEGQNLSAAAALSDIQPTGGETGPNPAFSTTTIAGQPSQCLSYNSAVTNVSMCVTDSGLLARLQANLGASAAAGASSGSSASTSLTSYSASAPASDFTPPAGVPIRSAGSSPAASGIGG
jgi:hypothetical protein